MPRAPGPSFEKSRIIGVALLATMAVGLAGCSLAMLRLTYNQAPSLMYWWLDDYADFDSGQKPRVRQVIDDWFRWHRRTQLTEYADLLGRAQAQVLEPTTAPTVCQWQDDVQNKLTSAFEQAVPGIAEVALTLTPEQVQHIEKRFAKTNKEFKDDFLQPDPQDRHEEAVKRSVKRFEMLYGNVEAGQLERIDRGIAASPFDADLMFAERRARQQDVLRALRGIDASAPQAALTLQSVLRKLAAQVLESPRPAYSAYLQRLDTYNCTFAAQIHNLSSPKQRRTAHDRLKGWEADLRSLAAQATSTPPQGAAGPDADIGSRLATSLR